MNKNYWLRDDVRNAALALDTLLPGWFRRVDVERLNISEPCLCILGQAIGEGQRDKHDNSGYEIGEVMGLRGEGAPTYTQQDGGLYVEPVPGIRYRYWVFAVRDTRPAWVEEITARLAADTGRVVRQAEKEMVSA